MSIRVEAEHGVVMTVKQGPYNYFGWPSVAMLGDGTIVAGCSGLRRAHICPWGRSTVAYSADGGRTYGDIQVVHDDLIDDRDLGVIALGGRSYAITWFSLDMRQWERDGWLKPDDAKAAREFMATWDDDTVATLMGSYVMITKDGGESWTRPIHVPVSSPHGFAPMRDGLYGYLGKEYGPELNRPFGDVRFAVSADGGYNWTLRGKVPLPEGESIDDYHEPHVLELEDGALLGVIRYHAHDGEGDGLDTVITRSVDGGYSWSVPQRMGILGAPPHLLRHSSGAIVLTYGYRRPGYGQRAVVSYDEGRTWSEDIIIRDDGESGDLGYPCSIELSDGSIYTVYYQRLPGEENTSILWSRWRLAVS